MRSIKISYLHKICHRNRQINSSCCSSVRSSNINGPNNNNYYHQSAAVRSLSSCTIRNDNTHSISISISIKSLRQNHHHSLLQSKFLRRHFSAASSSSATPIDTAHAGHLLLKGLDVHTVSSEMDGHPLAVYTVQKQEQDDDDDDSSSSPRNENRTPLLLLHGRTWSSVPVYHLVGEEEEEEDDDNDNTREESEESNNFSLMEALYNTGHIQPYAMDFRGFGGTPKDEEGYVEPLKCVHDVVSVLKWVHNNEAEESSSSSNRCRRPPALLGWSHGALIAQIVAQRHPEHLSRLILYSSIYNPNIKYSIPPPFEDPSQQHTDHDDFPLHEMTAPNEYDLAMADFTNYFDSFKPHNNNSSSNKNSSSSSTVHSRQYQPPKSAKLFANAALISDPIKVQWWNLHQLNECHPSQITSTPTLVVAGDNDPYVPMVLQAELFTNLRMGVDRTWSIIANADHAVHLSEERGRFVQSVGSFVQNK